ncbi:uncharacterized protein LOC134706150 [Mytilus trossulus]|uniref:uncharacterized protein LOC134706150 n=1 Tax=Mytilus trossulus TaxID=6551 RepID=UPI0030054879
MTVVKDESFFYLFNSKTCDYDTTTGPAVIVTVSQLPKVPRQKNNIPDIPVISYIEKPSLDHTYCTSTEVSEDVSIEEKFAILIENSNALEQKCQRYETDNNQLQKQVKLLQVELHATKEENKVLNEKFNNTDELLKDKLVEKLTKSNSNVKCFLGLPSISMLFGIFKLLEGHASKMKYLMGPDSSDGATLNMPPFTRPCKHGKGRCLTAKEIKESKSIASLRIHVERSIQRLKSYKFLSGVMPINSLSVANQALKVAGFFCNLMKPLVQKL